VRSVAANARSHSVCLCPAQGAGPNRSAYGTQRDPCCVLPWSRRRCRKEGSRSGACGLCGRLWSRRSITGQWVWLSYILLAKKGEIRVLTFSKDLSSAWTEFRNCRISTVCSFLRWTRKVRKASSSLSRAWQLCNRSSTRTVSFCTWGLNSSFPSPIVAIRRARFLRACVLCSVGGYRVIFSRKPHPSTGLSERNPTLDNHVKLSASFRYLSGFRALQRFQEHAEFARTNSLLQIKVFSFVNRRSSYRITFS